MAGGCRGERGVGAPRGDGAPSLRARRGPSREAIWSLARALDRFDRIRTTGLAMTIATGSETGLAMTVAVRPARIAAPAWVQSLSWIASVVAERGPSVAPPVGSERPKTIVSLGSWTRSGRSGTTTLRLV